MLFIALQIGDLFQGKWNSQGALHLFLFILMGGSLLAMSVFLCWKAFKPKDK